MTSEQDFQNALDIDPTNHALRMIFADWLDDHDDPRAAGYRALGLNLHSPQREFRSVWNPKQNRWNKRRRQVWHWMGTITGTGRNAVLKAWWHDLMDQTTFDSRRAAEDAAALAFRGMPLSRQAKLLGGYAGTASSLTGASS